MWSINIPGLGRAGLFQCDLPRGERDPAGSRAGTPASGSGAGPSTGQLAAPGQASAHVTQGHSAERDHGVVGQRPSWPHLEGLQGQGPRTGAVVWTPGRALCQHGSEQPNLKRKFPAFRVRVTPASPSHHTEALLRKCWIIWYLKQACSFVLQIHQGNDFCFWPCYHFYKFP